jgi:hypothetical protein
MTAAYRRICDKRSAAKKAKEAADASALDMLTRRLELFEAKRVELIARPLDAEWTAEVRDRQLSNIEAMIAGNVEARRNITGEPEHVASSTTVTGAPPQAA